MLYNLSLSQFNLITKSTLLEVCSSLTHLVKLNLSHTKTDNAVVQTIAKYMQHLESLNIANCKVYDKGVMALLPDGATGYGCPKMSTLDLENLHTLSVNGIELLLTGLPELQYLNHPVVCNALANLTSRNDIDMQQLNLLHIFYDYQESTYIAQSDIFVSEIFHSLHLCCPNITKLDLCLQQSSDDGLGQVLKMFTSIVDLSLTSVDNFTATILPLLRSHGDQLLQLCLNDVNGIAFRYILKFCTELTRLSIQLEPRNMVDVKLFPKFEENENLCLPHLEYLSLIGFDDNTHSFNDQVNAGFWMKSLLLSPLLHTIHLQQVTALTDDIFLAAMTYSSGGTTNQQLSPFSHLTELACSDCPQVTAQPFIDLITTAETNMKSLHILDCWHVDKKDHLEIEQIVNENNYDLDILYR